MGRRRRVGARARARRCSACLDDRAGFDPRDPRRRAASTATPTACACPAPSASSRRSCPAVLSQRVTGFEAKRSYRQLVERWGEPAPGPGGLLLPPAARRRSPSSATTSSTSSAWRRSGPTPSSGSCAHATRLEAAGAAPSAELRERLEAIPGVGPWTSAEVARVALGDADAVSVGDFHLKHLVALALAGEPRGTDARMLELLEPFAGHRGRVCLLLERPASRAPRYGPRSAHPAASPVASRVSRPSGPPRSG